jgi:hypothetical protein
VILVVLGVFFLAAQLVPSLRIWELFEISWPIYVIGAGVLIFLLGLIFGEPDMAVPACIVAGVGGLLYWQNDTGNWSSWAYAWTLIPGFAGVGTILSGLLRPAGSRRIRDGLGTVLVSLVLFGIFGSFLGGGIALARYWPVLLILLGGWLLVQAYRRRG